MTPRLSYLLKTALRLHTGSWFTDTQLEALVEYLASQKVTVQEVGE